MVQLDQQPALLPMFGKAALSTVLPSKKSAKTLPDTALARHEIVVDPAHLKAYNDVCGFRFSDELPSTYLHILAFPMQVKLMTADDFPFPLIGAVHVSNKITQRRPVRIDEPFSLQVHTENLRDHDKGKQFDVVSQVTIGDEAVWTDVSTYLRRGGGSGAKGPKKAALAAPTPKQIWRLPGDIGRRYASVAGDYNPIHLHPLTARLLGFPKAIAHGMYTYARALAAFDGKLPDAYEIDARFKLPVLLPAKAGFTSWSTDDGYAFELWDARKPKPYLEGTITAL